MSFAVVNLIVRALSAVLSAFELCLLVRAICSWIPSARYSRVYDFFHRITEPVLSPVRDIFMRWEFARRCPIDLSFIAVLVLLTIAQRSVYLLYYLVI